MVEINNRTRQKVRTAPLKEAAERFLSEYGCSKRAVSIALVGDAVMRRLNREYLGRDGQTDVFAFNYDGAGTDPEKKPLLGEIIINYAQVKRQARRYGNQPFEELLFVLVHGLLHLAGYNDKTEAERRRMDEKTEKFISGLKADKASK